MLPIFGHGDDISSLTSIFPAIMCTVVARIRYRFGGACVYNALSWAQNTGRRQKLEQLLSLQYDTTNHMGYERRHGQAIEHTPLSVQGCPGL